MAAPFDYDLWHRGRRWSFLLSARQRTGRVEQHPSRCRARSAHLRHDHQPWPAVRRNDQADRPHRESFWSRGFYAWRMDRNAQQTKQPLRGAILFAEDGRLRSNEPSTYPRLFRRTLLWRWPHGRLRARLDPGSVGPKLQFGKLGRTILFQWTHDAASTLSNLDSDLLPGNKAIDF